MNYAFLICAQIVLLSKQVTAPTQPCNFTENVCLNGGRCVVQNKKDVLCECHENYSGKRCETYNNICKDAIVGGLTPCLAQNMSCRAVPHGGYLCKPPVFLHKMKHCQHNQNLCPTNWDCFDLTYGFRCDSLVETPVMELTKRKRSTFLCANMPCQFGSVCHEEKCNCLTHFEGKYCEKMIDGCEFKPCDHRVPCLSRFGGFTCSCPDTYMGTRCQHRKDVRLSTMKLPDFLFEPLLYVNLDYYFVFYSADMGTLPRIKVDFGDGVVMRRSRQFKYFENAFSILNKHFQTILKLKSGQVFVYSFKHKYNEFGVYTIRVKAWNRYYLVFNSEYQVRVVTPYNCRIQLKLSNTARNPAKALTFWRYSLISIYSSTTVTCQQTQLNYQWIIYKVDNFTSQLSNDSIYKIQETFVNLKSAYLNLNAFSLIYGPYVAKLVVTMVSPIPGVQEEALTWFRIKRRRIVAHIDGGTFVYANANVTFFVDASMSYDPNYPKNEQPPLEFKWHCNESVPFCLGPLNETGPVLIVPEMSLEPGFYNFSVSIGLPNEPHVGEFAGRRSQVVQVDDRNKPMYRIRCVKNCVGLEWQNNRVTCYVGTCLNCETSNRKDSTTTWTYYATPQTDSQSSSTITNSELGIHNPMLIVYGSAMALDHSRFVFGGNAIVSEESEEGDGSDVYEEFGKAETSVGGYEAPELRRCSVTPQQGYTLITLFSIECTFLNSSIVNHDVRQVFDLWSANDSSILVGYDMVGEISNLVVAPGLERLDYVTTLFFTFTSPNGKTTGNEVNITVFPIIFYYKDSGEVLHYFNSLGNGYGSQLGMLLSGGRYIEMVQLITSATLAFDQFLDEDDSSSLDGVYVTKSVVSIRDKFLSYLHRIEVVDVRMMKHVATALERILGLKSDSIPWGGNILIAIHILKKVINRLEDSLRLHKERITELDMDDMGLLLANIISYTTLVHNFGSGNVETVLSTNHGFNQVSEIAFQYLALYDSYKIVNEHITVIAHPKLSLALKKSAPEYLLQKSYRLGNKVAVRCIFNESLFGKGVVYNLKLITIDDIPNWFDNKDGEFSFPFIKMNLTNDFDGTPIEDVEFEAHLQPIPERTDDKFVKGAVPVRLFWQIQEKHIQIYRIMLPKGGKLMVTFKPLDYNFKLRIVIKKNVRPNMLDFWHSGIDIPMTVNPQDEDPGLSVYVDDEATEDNEFYYLGILPHITALQEIMRDIEEPILPNFFNYDDNRFRFTTESAKEPFDDQDDFNNAPAVKYIKELKIVRNTEYNNLTVPFSFTASSLKCLSWDVAKQKWTKICSVKYPTTKSRVVCSCPRVQSLTVSSRSIPVSQQKISNVPFFISFMENPLIVFLVILSFVIFLGLFAWAIHKDRKDAQLRNVCFLIDNYPSFNYTYLVIVVTGRAALSDSSSSVSITLEGTNGTSLPHILKDWRRNVLRKGCREWFVIQTVRPLGEIYCLHMWIDYSGCAPSWYCDKIIVQDVQEQEIWFFVIGKWFDPLHGDGSMAYTVYQTTDASIFTTRYYMNENIVKEFDSGMHGWFSIFSKYAHNNYTRAQRVAVVYTHLAMILLILILFNEIPTPDVPTHQINTGGTFKFNGLDIVTGLYAALMVFPFHLFLVWMFRCIKPAPQWTESNTEKCLEGFNISEDGSVGNISVYALDRRDSKLPVTDGKSISTDLKSVSFASADEYDYERRLLSQNRSQTAAGKSKIVPLRSAVSMIETNLLSMPVSTSEVNPPIYGKEIVQESFCCPSWVVYFGWTLLVTIIGICTYYTILHGVSYGWVLSLHYIISFLSAVFISVFILETLKLLFFSWYIFWYNHKEFSVEDRSDLVYSLNPFLSIPEEYVSTIVEKIDSLRDAKMYKPIETRRVKKLIRNKKMEAVIRSHLIDLTITILFIVILICILFHVLDPLSYLHYKNVDSLISEKAFGRTDLERVDSFPAFVHYLNSTLIPTLFYYGQYVDNTQTLEPVHGEVNYLVGVVRLRQVRKTPRPCQFGTSKKWATRCEQIFDKSNHHEGWKKNASTIDDYEKAGFIVDPWGYSSGKALQYPDIKNGSYPQGAYATLLKRTKEQSRNVLNYLNEKNWIDNLTTVVFVDFVLFNINLEYLSSVVLMAERTEQGRLYVYKNIDIVKLRASDTYSEIIISILFFLLLTIIICFIFRETVHVDWTYGWYKYSKGLVLLGVVLCVLGFFSLVIFIKRATNLNYYHERIIDIDKETYIDFEKLIFWNDCLVTVASIMVFVSFVKLWFVVGVFYTARLVISALNRAKHEIMGFFFMLTIIYLAFALSGYIIFSRYSYCFQYFGNSFLAIVGFSQRNFNAEKLQQPPELTGTAILYNFALFIVLILVFRWIIVAVLMFYYTKAKAKRISHARKSLFLNCDGNYRYAFEVLPNRNHLRKVLLKNQREPKLRAMGFLFADAYNKIRGADRKISDGSRLAAMKAIAIKVLKENYKYLDFIKITRNKKEDEVRRAERIKAVTFSFIVANSLINKMEYLSAKIDAYIIRDSRYYHKLPKK